MQDFCGQTQEPLMRRGGHWLFMKDFCRKPQKTSVEIIHQRESVQVFCRKPQKKTVWMSGLGMSVKDFCRLPHMVGKCSVSGLYLDGLLHADLPSKRSCVQCFLLHKVSISFCPFFGHFFHQSFSFLGEPLLMSLLDTLARADIAVLVGIISLFVSFFLSLYQLVRPKGK